MKTIQNLMIFVLTIVILLSCTACSNSQDTEQIVATTLPVYNFTTALCEGTGLKVSQLINEPVSCLHNYTLQVSQMRMAENADILVISGAGYEGFLHDVISSKDNIIDSSGGIALACAGHSHEEHHHEQEGHHHEYDPHIWLSPVNARIMVQNICDGLSRQYPDHAVKINSNCKKLIGQLNELEQYGKNQLGDLKCRNLITFHDGFHYLAECFDLNIIKAIEEEPGSETSAAELKELITFVKKNNLPAIFTETNGSEASAKVISSDTGCAVYALDMIMYGTNYFDAMYHNINTIKEALG